MAKNKNTIYIIAGLILVAGLVYYFFFRKKNEAESTVVDDLKEVVEAASTTASTSEKEATSTPVIIGGKTSVKGTGTTSGTKLLKPIIATKAPTKTGAVKLDIGAGMV